ncbi:uncharacterized protein An07g08310 [Aspergillus niger]|uniref:Copper transport protein n=2 Tax=Aspergillus niger TaxID=5061 RepID=A2QP60_ASPNC|nr:uncharacterized protein An07g08310 [Aspergillus niger]CAK48213.1 unnamed protein product [Aspergillus niger]
MDMTSSTIDISMDSPSCKISMLWNWNTVDACFISESWHITSSCMFAGSCIGIVFLVICLELLRRMASEYDAFIINRARLKADTGDATKQDQTQFIFRPSQGERIIRATLHVLQFAVAYFVMLLGMYYNGYIIVCIFVGAFVGFLLFSSGKVVGDEIRNDATSVTKCCG